MPSTTQWARGGARTHTQVPLTAEPCFSLCLFYKAALGLPLGHLLTRCPPPPSLLNGAGSRGVFEDMLGENEAEVVFHSTLWFTKGSGIQL